MRPIDAVAIAAQAGIPVLAEGEPGTGKTASISAWHRDLGRHLETLIGSIMDPVDVGGTQFVGKDGTLQFGLPQWAKRLFEAKGGTLFLDELTCAPPAVQAALLRVIHEKYVGGVPLPADTWMISACNPPEIAAGGFNLAAPLANRFFHVAWTLDPKAWTRGIVAGFPADTVARLPESWRSHLPKALGAVSGYISTRPDELLRRPKTEAEQGGAWASPRTWEMACTLIAAVRSLGMGRDDEYQVAAGSVGAESTRQFFVWQDAADLPDPETLLADPSKFKADPTRSDRTHAMISGVTAAVLASPTRERGKAGWEILFRCASQGKVDVAAEAGRALADLYQSGKGEMVISDILSFLPPFTSIFQQLARAN